MTLYVVQRYLDTPAAGLHTIEATTTPEVHLHARWSPNAPTKTPRYITLGGMAYQCGWRWTWPPPVCYDQAEPGPTLAHTWTIPLQVDADPGVIALVEADDCIFPAPSTPPIPLTPIPCIPPAPFTRIALTDPFPLSLPPGPETTLTWATVLGTFHWPFPGLPLSQLRPPGCGPFFENLFLPYTAPSPFTIRLRVYDDSTSQLLRDETTNQPAGSNFLTLQGAVITCQANHLYRTTLQNLSGGTPTWQLPPLSTPIYGMNAI